MSSLRAPQTVRDAIDAASTKGIVLASSTGNTHLLYALDFGTLGPPPNMPPVASFTALSTGLTVGFTDTPTDSDGAIQVWAWDFGDGNTANLPSPTHTYAAGATYTVTLTVTDDAGAVTSSTRPIAVSLPSTAILLGDTGRAVKNKTYADLAWSGAPGASPGRSPRLAEQPPRRRASAGNARRPRRALPSHVSVYPARLTSAAARRRSACADRVHFDASM
jgi:PKD repeat protein